MLPKLAAPIPRSRCYRYAREILRLRTLLPDVDWLELMDVADDAVIRHMFRQPVALRCDGELKLLAEIRESEWSVEAQCRLVLQVIRGATQSAWECAR